MSGFSERAVCAGVQCPNYLRLRTKSKRIKVQGKALAGRLQGSGVVCFLGLRVGCNRRWSDGQHLLLVPCVRHLPMDRPLFSEVARTSDRAPGIVEAGSLSSLRRKGGTLGSGTIEAASMRLCCSASLPHHSRSALQDEQAGAAAQNFQRVSLETARVTL